MKQRGKGRAAVIYVNNKDKKIIGGTVASENVDDRAEKMLEEIREEAEALENAEEERLNDLRKKIQGLGKQKVDWDTDYDYHDDKCYQRPICPVCGYLIFGLEDDECEWCGAKLDTDDEKLKKYMEENTGVEERLSACECGGQLHVFFHKRRGEWRSTRGYCDKCGMHFIV